MPTWVPSHIDMIWLCRLQQIFYLLGLLGLQTPLYFFEVSMTKITNANWQRPVVRSALGVGVHDREQLSVSIPPPIINRIPGMVIFHDMLFYRSPANI